MIIDVNEYDEAVDAHLMRRCEPSKCIWCRGELHRVAERIPRRCDICRQTIVGEPKWFAHMEDGRELWMCPSGCASNKHSE